MLANSDDVYEVFVSMPYGRDDKSVKYWQTFYQYAIQDINALFKGRGYSLNFVRADQRVNALVLKDNVRASIDRCQLCLAVITGNNPNVFWEVGYAASKEKPTIFIVEADAKDAEYSPVLVSEALKEAYDGKIFDNLSPDKAQVLNFQQRLLRYFDIAIQMVKGTKKPQYRIFSNRRDADLPSEIINAQDNIGLITTNLSYYADVDSFIAEHNGASTFAFDPPVNRGVKVQILILNPESIVTEYRAKQLGRGHEVAEYREELRQAAKSFYHRYIKNKNVDIRIYDDLPSQITLRVDDRIITSFVSRGQQARHNIHVGFDMDFKSARATFEKHFAEVLANQGQTTHISNFAWAQIS